MTDAVEPTREGLGADPTGLVRAVELVRARGAVAQLCVLHRGEVALDRTFGCEPDLVERIVPAHVRWGQHVFVDIYQSARVVRLLPCGPRSVDRRRGLRASTRTLTGTP